MPSRRVVNEVAEGLRQPGRRGFRQDTSDLGGVPSGFEGALDRRLADSVDGGMAPGLDIGDAPERSAEPGSDRPGRDDRHVSLDEDVIDEGGHGVGHCGSSLRFAILRGFGDEHAGSCAERAPDHHSEEQALRERRCDDLLPELARAPRLAVVEDRRDARRVDHGAGRSLGQQ